MTFARRLARHIESITSISKEEAHKIKRAIIDRLGCALCARRIGIGNKLIEILSEENGSQLASLWGIEKKVPALYAALANGSISSHLEYDTNDSMIPAAFSIAEIQHVTGEKLMIALKAGYQTLEVVKNLFASEVEQRGLHWPAYLAAFPAAVACSKILDLNEDGILAALGIAGSLSPATPFEAFTKGADIKDFYGGWGNMLGLMAALLSNSGFSGPESIFEGERGLGRMWFGESPKFQIFSKMIPIGQDIHFRIGIKPYPCCTAVHPTLTALENLLSENPDLKLKNISRVDVSTYAFGAALSKASTPTNSISAKINIPYLTAVMLMYGKLLPEHSEFPYLKDIKLKQLASKVKIHTIPDSDIPLPKRNRPAHVKIKTLKGIVLESFVKNPKWNQENQPTDKELKIKFYTLIGDFLTIERRGKLYKKINFFEDVVDISEIIELMLP